MLVEFPEENQLWGLLIAHECGAPRTWQSFEIDLLQQLADQTEIAPIQPFYLK